MAGRIELPSRSMPHGSVPAFRSSQMNDSVCGVIFGVPSSARSRLCIRVGTSSLYALRTIMAASRSVVGSRFVQSHFTLNEMPDASVYGDSRRTRASDCDSDGPMYGRLVKGGSRGGTFA